MSFFIIDNYRPSALNEDSRFCKQNSNVIRRVRSNIESFHRSIQPQVYSIFMYVLLLYNNHVTLWCLCWIFFVVIFPSFFSSSHSIYQFSFHPRFLDTNQNIVTDFHTCRSLAIMAMWWNASKHASFWHFFICIVAVNLIWRTVALLWRFRLININTKGASVLLYYSGFVNC